MLIIADVRLIDVNAAIIDLREQIVAFFGEAKKEVKPEDYYITKLSAYHEDLERLQIDNFIAYLNSRPTINPEDLRPQGRWTETNWAEYDGHGEVITHYEITALKCSNCCCCFKKEALWRRNYCPNCGAKMDGKENEDA